MLVPAMVEVNRVNMAERASTTTQLALTPMPFKMLDGDFKDMGIAIYLHESSCRV